jgi:diguanylate cyclase (GGDEF)-like protein
MSRRNRPLGYLMLLAIVLIHMVQQGSATWHMAGAALYFLLYPPLAYVYASRSPHGLKAEMAVMRLETAFLGGWVAALGFPIWIGYVFFVVVVLNLTLFASLKGGVEAFLLFAVPALAVFAVGNGGFLQPETGWVVTLLCMVALMFYLLLLADVVYRRTRRLHEIRHQLRGREAELSRQLEDNQNLQSQLVDKANRDGLTGLFNRHYLEAVIHGEVARCDREKLPICLLMLDLDHFKGINDRYGHPVGDEVLRSLANLIQTLFRGTDIPCRYGGEEFLVLMPGAHLENATRRAETLRKAFSELDVQVRGRALRATLSVGVAQWGLLDIDSVAKWVSAADWALYQAKLQGRNQVVTAQAASHNGWDRLATMPGALPDTP